MPVYEGTATYDELRNAERNCWCAECGGILILAWNAEHNCHVLRCGINRAHDGISRQRKPSQYEQQFLDETRRRELNDKVGTDRATALAKYQGVTSLTAPIARDMLLTFWPNAEKASPREFIKALGLCVNYGLDPRINDLHMIPFKVKDKDRQGKVTGEHTEYVTVRGISATRKVARRNHPYISYIVGPRYMTEAEEKEAFHDVDPNKVRFIVRLKDLKTGAEAPGYGEWPKYRTWTNPNTGEIKQYPNEPKGVEKGNTKENMAGIHAERQAYERLFPADMQGMTSVPVVDERYEPDNLKESPSSQVIEGESTELTPDDDLFSQELQPEDDQVKPPTATSAVTTPKQLIRARADWGKVTKEQLADYGALEKVFCQLSGKSTRDMYKELGVSSRQDMTIAPWNAFVTLREMFTPKETSVT